MIPTTPETAGLYVSACHRAEDSESAKEGLLGKSKVGLLDIGMNTYRRTILECAKAGDTDGVLELYMKAQKDGKSTQDILHMVVRACLNAGEMQKASALVATAQECAMPVADV